MEPLDFAALKAELIEKHGEHIRDRDVLSSAMYPKVFDEFAEFAKSYGPVDKLDTRTFFVGPNIAQELSVSSVVSVRPDYSLSPFFSLSQFISGCPAMRVFLLFPCISDQKKCCENLKHRNVKEHHKLHTTANLSAANVPFYSYFCATFSFCFPTFILFFFFFKSYFTLYFFT